MNNSLYILIFSKYRFKTSKIQTIQFFKSRTNTRHFFNVVYHISIGIGQIVYNNHLKTCILKFYDCVRADITGTSRN